MSVDRVRGLLLVAFGLAVAKVAAGDELLRFLRPGLRPVVLAAAAVLVVAGALVAHRHRLGAAPDAHRGRSAVALLVAPTLLTSAAAPPALGAFAAGRPATRPAAPDHGFARLPATGPVSLTVSELVLRTVWEHGNDLDGRTVRVTGFVARSETHGFVLARLVITCCAADARPFDVEVRARAPSPTADTWVTVAGRYRHPSSPDGLVPVLVDATFHEVTAPRDPYG